MAEEEVQDEAHAYSEDDFEDATSDRVETESLPPCPEEHPDDISIMTQRVFVLFVCLFVCIFCFAPAGTPGYTCLSPKRIEIIAE